MSQIMSQSRRLRVFIAVVMVLTVTFSGAPSASATVTSQYSSYVFGPLTQITDWTSFDSQLDALRNNGITGISTDVWWGQFEANGDQQFSWTYYQTYVTHVRDHGLKWVPILSFHQCGGNVGDNCNIPIPSWLSSKVANPSDQLDFVNESGFHNREYLSFWSGIDVQQYDEAMTSFASNFSSYASTIDSVHVGMGPAGELRYPSYNAAAGWSYPQRGKLQSYSNVAKQAFRDAMVGVPTSKYSSLTALNTAWGTSLSNSSQISPPTDGDNFFISGRTSQYGQDFLNWYQGTLLKHLDNVMSAAHTRLDSLGKPLAAKIAGVHWLADDAGGNGNTMPHSAEYCAGYYNYSTILDRFKADNADAVFTAIELNDARGYPNYSTPKTIAINVATLAKAKGIKIYGENALAIANNVAAYQNSAELLFNYSFAGFTLLRLSNIVNSNGSAVVNSGVNELTTFADLIALKPITITFTVNNAPAVGAGEAIYVVGERREMGMWDPYYYATPMTRISGTNNWTVSVYLGLNRSYNFKMIKKAGSGGGSSNIVWENGANKNYYTWLPGPDNSSTNWQY